MMIWRALLAACLSATLACAIPDPRDPSQRHVERGARGGWVEALTRSGERVKGELIAVSPRGIYVLEGVEVEGQWIEQRVVLVKANAIRGAKVWGYQHDTFWSVGGGFLLYINALTLIIPAAMIASTSQADNELLQHSTAVYRAKKVKDFNRWARFPQGMPKGLDPDRLVSPPLPLPSPARPGAPAAPASPNAFWVPAS